MVRVFVYEYLTARGTGRDPGSPEHSLYREGRAMRDAVVEDFRRIPGCEARIVGTDAGDTDHDRAFDAALDWCEFCLAIAPETGMVLRDVCREVERRDRRLLGPSSSAVELTTRKDRLGECWERAGVPTPKSYGWNEWFAGRDTYPAVCKPRDGAGSAATFYLGSPNAAKDLPGRLTSEGFSEQNTLFQPYIAGLPASVSFLVAGDTAVALPPTFQTLSTDGRFRYLGGTLPIPSGLADRATRLARRAIECVPGLFGYVGVDLVLGDAGDGSSDYAIEINPRLTTSYIGLRRLAGFNIAGAMVSLAGGATLPEMSWKPGRVEFDAGDRVLSDFLPGGP